MKYPMRLAFHAATFVIVVAGGLLSGLEGRSFCRAAP